MKEVGPFDEGTSVTLECSSYGGRPLPEVRWYNGTRPMRSKMSLHHTADGVSVVTASIRFITSRHDLTSKFDCRVANNATRIPLSRAVRFDIHTSPVSLHVRGPVTARVAGEMVSLTCVVDGARPAANITWYNRSEPVIPHPVSVIEQGRDGTYRTTNTLAFIVTRFDHNADFFCKGTNDVMRVRNEVPLLQANTMQVLCKYKIYIKLIVVITINCFHRFSRNTSNQVSEVLIGVLSRRFPEMK